ncbi:MAG TPA: response regulator, partial [Acidobacteriota bacterium]
MSMLRVLIVDDEQPARLGLRKRLEAHHDVEIVGEAADGLSAVEAIEAQHPDLVFLDIQMPQLDGFSVIEALSVDPPPAIVFVTAYDEYALKAFEVQAIDYLLKPVEPERLAESLGRVRQRRQTSAAAPPLEEMLRKVVNLRRPTPLDKLPVRKRDRIVLLDADDVFWAEAEGGLAMLHTFDDQLYSNYSLRDLEERLPAERFFRVHRSALVNLAKVKEILPWFSGLHKLVLGDKAGTQVTLSRAQARKLREVLKW